VSSGGVGASGLPGSMVCVMGLPPGRGTVLPVV
jgi:hypothetical protein